MDNFLELAMTSRTTRRRVIWLLIFFSAALPLLASNSFAQSQPKTPAKPTPVESVEETWQVTHIGGKRIGYQYSRERVELRDKQKVVITVNDSHTTLKRFGQELKMSSSLRIEETASGDLLRFSYEMKNPPIQDTLTEGVVNGEQLELTSTLAGRTDKRRVAWEAETKSPAFPDRWLREHPLKPGESKSFKVYLPEFAKFSQEHFAADELGRSNFSTAKKSRCCESKSATRRSRRSNRDSTSMPLGERSSPRSTCLESSPVRMTCRATSRCKRSPEPNSTSPSAR